MKQSDRNSLTAITLLVTLLLLPACRKEQEDCPIFIFPDYPPRRTLAVGEKTELAAGSLAGVVGLSFDCRPVRNFTTRWESSNPRVASVNAVVTSEGGRGEVEGLAPGQAEIRALAITASGREIAAESTWPITVTAEH